MKRRNFLKTSLKASLAFVPATAACSFVPGQETPKPKKLLANYGEGPEKCLTFYPDTENGKLQLYQLWVRKNNTVLTSYRAHQTEKYPYFHPLAGPVSGLSLTSESARPWPHHRALFFGCDKVNGGNYWQGALSQGQIISQGPSFVKDTLTETSGVIVDQCLWRQGDKDPIISDSRRFTIRIVDDKRYVMDAEIDVTALTDITIQQTNHGLFGIRCAPELAPSGGGNLLSSEGGRNEKDTLGKPAKWIAFYGKRPLSGAEITEGIAVFCPSKEPHPRFKDCPWFVRDYGNISPTPMNWLGKDDFKLPKGDGLKLRYRVVAFAGTPQDANLNDLWEEFNSK
ncbi:MAG: PmoA family protein [Planctomycetaceae bacterium]|jgi:hypothetical protein|nr:PmoA family protein [Planctomycetaceae bacterium]